MVYLYLGRNKFNGTQPDPLVVTALCASSAQLPNDNTCFVCMGACVFVFESILSSLDTLLLVIANQNFQGINSVRRTRPMTDENCCIAQSEVCILHQFSNFPMGLHFIYPEQQVYFPLYSSKQYLHWLLSKSRQWQS